MIKRKNFLARMLAVVLSGSLLAGCSNSNSEVNKGTEEDSLSSAKELNIVNGKIEPAVTITSALADDGVHRKGESISDNGHFKWAKEKLGIDIKLNWSTTPDQFDSKLRLMLASGDKLPDVFRINNKDTYNMFVQSGRLLSIDEAFDKYASDVAKNAMSQAPKAWIPYQNNGKHYGIPALIDDYATSPVLWIRKDWLDKFGLQPPKTMQDLEKILDVFTNGDPDGNGKKDTFGISFSLKDGFANKSDGIRNVTFGNVSWVFGAHGVVPGIWRANNGKLEATSVQPEIKQGLETLNQWYQKGYMPQDVALYDFNKMTELAVNGKLGVFAAPRWIPSYYVKPSITKNDPKADFQPYPIPVGPDGKAMRDGSYPETGAVVISKDISPETLQAFFHYYNCLYGAMVTEDVLYFRDFQEGYIYTVKDGKPDWDVSKLPDGQIWTGKYSIVAGVGASNPIDSERFNVVYKKIANGEPLNKNDVAVYASADLPADKDDPGFALHAKGWLVADTQKSIDVLNEYLGPSTTTMSSRGELLVKLQNDTFMSIIYGKEPIEKFDQFVDKWYSSGGDQITEEVNEWYAALKK